MSTRPAWRHDVEYFAVASVAAVVKRLPRRAVSWCGTLLGLLVYACDGPHRRLAQANLQAAFPTRSRSEMRVLSRQVFGHFGRLLLELLKFSSLPRERMLELVEFEGLERIEHAHAQGRGVLLFTGHFGFWELQALAHGATGRPMAVFARVLDNPRLNALLEEIRTSTGNSVIYRRGGVRRVFRALAAKQTVALLIDQHIHNADAVHVDFFSRPAATTSALAALALRTGAPVIPAFALPLRGGRYRMIYEHAVAPPRAGDPDAVREFTQRCTDVLEMYVRRYPEVWLWMHRRWRDTHSADAPAAMFPAAAPGESTDDEVTT